MRSLWRVAMGVFPSLQSGVRHVADVHRFCEVIGEPSRTRFHRLHNWFITVAESGLMLPRSLSKRLVDCARPQDVAKGYTADWTVEQLREPAQRNADRIDALMSRAEPARATV